MFEFTEAERIYLTPMYALARDEQGKEVLVGLTVGETVYLMEHRRNFGQGIRERDPDRKDKALVLGRKHEAARLRVIGQSHREH